MTGPEKKATLTRTEIPVEEKEQPAGGEKEPEKKQETAWLDETGKRADGEAVDRLLGSLSRLECESYLEGKTKEDFKEPLYTVAVVGPEEHLLFVYRKGEEGRGVSRRVFPEWVALYPARSPGGRPEVGPGQNNGFMKPFEYR